jgi:transcriptional regulator with XRE-family HTH domain
MDKSGTRIRNLRIKRGLSQRELAKKLGMSATTLSRYENNIHVFAWESLRRLVLELNTSADYLLSITDVNIPFKDILNATTNKKLDWDSFEKFSKLDLGRQIALLESTCHLIDPADDLECK